MKRLQLTNNIKHKKKPNMKQYLQYRSLDIKSKNRPNKIILLANAQSSSKTIKKIKEINIIKVIKMGREDVVSN